MSTVPHEHFDALYAESEDPYGFDDRWYEKRKRALLLAALPRDRYANAYEPGCANGHLTVQLAKRCDALRATDVSADAVELTRRRVAAFGSVVIAQESVPHEWAPGPFDLVVVSELAYYLDDSELADLVDRCVASVQPGGTVVISHWRRSAPFHPQSAESTHLAFTRRRELEVVGHWDDDDFVLDVLVKDTRPRSVAQLDGIVP